MRFILFVVLAVSLSLDAFAAPLDFLYKLNRSLRKKIDQDKAQLEKEQNEVFDMLAKRMRPELNGLFGVTFGDRYSGETGIGSYLSCPVGKFRPKAQFLSFTQYYVILPDGDRVSGVLAAAQYETRQQQDSELEKTLRAFKDFEKMGRGFTRVNDSVYFLDCQSRRNGIVTRDCKVMIYKNGLETILMATDDFDRIMIQEQKAVELAKDIEEAEASDEETKVSEALFGRSEQKMGKESAVVQMLRKAAEQGLPVAQCDLGNSYYNGEGVEQDKAEAVRWYRKAAEQGVASAQFNLGVCYYNGKGVEQDKQEAVKWFRKAAAKGCDPAKKALERLNRGKQ